LPLCLIGAAPLLVEGAGIDWFGDLYARRVRRRAVSSAAVSITVFSLFMALARLFMDPVVGPLQPAGRSPGRCSVSLPSG